MSDSEYSRKYCLRTKKFAVDAVLFFAEHCKRTEELRIIGKQLLRSATSVGANFRAFARGRSNAERYSKMCIVVEEADETLFWLEIIEEANLIQPQLLSNLKQEAEELVKIFAVSRTNLTH